MNEWLNKMWYIDTMVLFSFEIEILIYDVTWVNLENVMLTGINQKQKKEHHMIPLTRVLTTAKFIVRK